MLEERIDWSYASIWVSNVDLLKVLPNPFNTVLKWVVISSFTLPSILPDFRPVRLGSHWTLVSSSKFKTTGSTNFVPIAIIPRLFAYVLTIFALISVCSATVVVLANWVLI